MDNQCFLAESNSQVNYMNCSMQDRPCIEAAKIVFRRVVEKYPKLRYKLTRIAGDLYYEEMTVEETLQKAFLF